MITVKCLWCPRSIEIQESSKIRMRGFKANEGIGGWYHNGLGYDPETGHTEVEFHLCPEHQNLACMQEAWRWAREQIAILRETVQVG